MRRRAVRGVMGLVVVLAVVDGVFGERGLLANMQLKQRNARQHASNDDLTAQNDAMTEDIRRLREDPSAVEELAREELSLLKDGELLIILRDAPGTSPVPKDKAAAATTSR